MVSPATPPRVLVVDDDSDIRELIVRQLSQEHFSLRSAGSVNELRQAVNEQPADVVILDLNLPDGDGLSLCRELRSEGFAGAIIMVTARDSVIDRVLGLELGADDYLTKPFEPRELKARVRNLLKRHQSSEWPSRRHARYAVFGPWRLDLLQRRLIAPDERLVMLSSAEFRLLQRFIDAPLTALSREQLLPERKATVAYDRSIDLQISRLRQKLAISVADGEVILTVRNEGYLLAHEVHYQ